MKEKRSAFISILLAMSLFVGLFPMVSSGAEPELAYYAEGLPNGTTAGEVAVTFHATNTTGQAVRVVVAVAVYDGEKIVDMKVSHQSIPEDSAWQSLCTLTVCVPENGDEMRAFLWREDAMEPIARVDAFPGDGATPAPTATPIPVKRLMVGHNVMNAPLLSVGYIRKNTGEVEKTATQWRTSPFLTVEPGQGIVSENSQMEACAIRFLAAYDENKQLIPEAGLARSTAEVGSMYVVPDGVAFVRLSVSANTIKNVDSGGWMVELKRMEDAVIPMDQWDDATPEPTGTECPGGGENTVQIARSRVPARGCVQLNTFPQNIKKGLTITYSAEFGEFTQLTIGKGFNYPWGDWLVIDNTAVMWKGFGSARDGRRKPHGLTIEDNLRVTLTIGSGRENALTCTLESGGQESSLCFAWLGEQNGLPFAYGKQEMTNVELSATVTDMNCPIWLFGDSYFGMSDDRVIGQLFGLGYGENCLIDGLPGQNSVGAYAELERLLRLGGKPQTLIWMLGMNDTDAGYQEAVQKLETLAEAYEFQLILMTVPIVPDKVNPGLIDAYVVSSGYRYVDACGAVGADENGNWYDGYLSEDQIHPTASGAKAIAEQLVKDVPEITATE